MYTLESIRNDLIKIEQEKYYAKHNPELATMDNQAIFNLMEEVMYKLDDILRLEYNKLYINNK